MSILIEKMEPMSVGQLLDRTFKLYSSNWSLLLGISAVLTLPMAAVMIGASALMQYAVDSDDTSMVFIGAGITFISAMLYGFVVYPWAQGASTFAISERYLNREVGIGQAIGHGWRRLGTLFNVSLSVGLRILLGFLLLIVPGIVWACTYAIAMPAVIIENETARDATES